MRLTHELAVSAPLEQTWRALQDVPALGRALPGATVDSTPVDGAHRGTMKVKLGPVVTEYSGLARLAELDEDERVAIFHVNGRELRGQGTAEATITIRARGAGEATKLTVETELQVTGRQAQLGRGIMEEVAAGVLREFAARLERTLAGLQPSGAAPAEEEEAFDAGRAMLRPLIERVALLLLGVLLGLGLRGRPRRR